jgi:ribosome-binding factor A
MSRRSERVASLIRDTIGQVLLTKLSDPRIDPALVSVTRVVVPEDLLTARVYISVAGTESQQRCALRALRHAAGRIQELMTRQVQLRNTPVLEFVQDEQFKKTLQTYQLIDQAMAEIRDKADRQARSSSSGDAPPSGPPTDPAEREQGSPG